MAKKLPNNEAAKRRIYQKYREGAKRRNISFKLSKKEFLKLTRNNCYYCNIEPSNKLESRDYYSTVTGEKKIYYFGEPFIYNGIDRLNNNKGYVKTNVVACCAICNRAKYRLSEKEFKEWIKRLCLHQK